MKNLLKVVAAGAAGAAYGLLFAQKPGKKLRAEISKSDNPLKTLFDESKKVGGESKEVIEKWAQESEELQKVIATGKDQFHALSKQAQTLSKEGKDIAIEKLEELATNAKKTAEELKEKASQQTNKFKNQVEKGIKNISDKI